jgi:uncharacterized repeat protein (TIGR03806 family)
MRLSFLITLTGALALAACGGGGGGGGGGDVSAREAPRLAFPTHTVGGTVDIERAFPDLSFAAPLSIQRAPGDRTHLYVAEQGGAVRVFDATDPDVSTSSVFIDLTDRTRAFDEQGLLGLAFDPDYATNGFVYVNYSANTASDVVAGDSVIARFHVPDRDARIADRDSEVQLLRFSDRFFNHNGGDLAFGPDKMLYISSGDGGSSNDPDQNAQNVEDLRGKILRIAPRGTAAQIIPVDNPFVGVAGRDEIWAYGLRNPFRMSFDGDRLWVGDVGQGALEEIDLIVKGGNYGWRKFEGTRLNFPGDPAIPSAIAPVYTYPRTDGTSITGGRVYRGSAVPALVGRYVYGDFIAGTVWALAETGGVATDNVRIGDVPGPSSFGVGLDGEILITAYDGHLYRLVPATGGTGPFPQNLSQTRLFSNLETLRPARGVVPYEPNAPFWSDGATKRRWIAVPGTTPRITFSESGNWDFPVGTVTVKHFEIRLADGRDKRLETRVFINTANDGWQGYTYRWNEAGTDATLLAGAESVDLVVDDGNGGTRNQTYEFPSRAQCQQCHTAAAGKVLGVRTSQLNGGSQGSQLVALEQAGYFDRPIGDPATLPVLSDPFGTASLETRARAYLETNCGQCHRPGGPTPVDMDLRASTSIDQTRTVGVTGQSGTVDGATIRIVAGDRATSLVWTRMNTLVEGERMPPLSTHVIDAAGVALIGDWIDAGAN